MYTICVPSNLSGTTYDEAVNLGVSYLRTTPHYENMSQNFAVQVSVGHFPANLSHTCDRLTGRGEKIGANPMSSCSIISQPWRVLRFSYPICSMSGIFTYKTGPFLGYKCRQIFQHHGAPGYVYLCSSTKFALQRARFFLIRCPRK